MDEQQEKEKKHKDANDKTVKNLQDHLDRLKAKQQGNRGQNQNGGQSTDGKNS